MKKLFYICGNKSIIKLSANESALGVSKNVEKIVKSKFDISKYPDSKFSELTQKISKSSAFSKSPWTQKLVGVTSKF